MWRFLLIKQRETVQPFKKFLKDSIKVPNKINIDLLGTFSGEIKDRLTPLETLWKKQEWEWMNLVSLLK